MGINNRRIAQNTVFMYIRMMIVMIINLYAVRIVLGALGPIDYGVYTIIAGVVTMLSFVTTVFATAIQRYYSFALGNNSINSLQKIFSISVVICIVIALLLIILGETIGLWFTNTQLVIPKNRLGAANYLYQTTLISFIALFVQTPYSAAIIAHEEMGLFATVSTIECIFKLGAALLLKLLIGDKLILYGLLLALISLLSLIAYIIIGKQRYPECHYTSVKDKTMAKELLSFSSWNLMGSLAGVGMHYVNTLLVNIFFGPIVNTAQAIAFQISSALNSFSASFIVAVRPPMIKSYAEQDFIHVNRLFDISNKFIYYCMLILCIPLVSEMRFILYYWLGVDDEQTILFCRLTVIYSLILVMNNPISIIMQATGYVKQYFVAVESLTLLCPVITYGLFKLGMPAYSTFIAMICCITGSHIIRILVLKKYYNQSILLEYFHFLVRALLVTLLAIAIILYARDFITSGIYRFIYVWCLTVITLSTLTYAFGIGTDDRTLINQMVKRILHK